MVTYKATAQTAPRKRLRPYPALPYLALASPDIFSSPLTKRHEKNVRARQGKVGHGSLVNVKWLTMCSLCHTAMKDLALVVLHSSVVLLARIAVKSRW